jgi:hypothetical protein
MKRRTRHDEEKEGWTSGGDLADVEETPRSRSDIPAVVSPNFSLLTNRLQEFVRVHVLDGEKRDLFIPL